MQTRAMTELFGLAEKLFHDFGFKAVVATEIEFYLRGLNASLPAAEVISLIESCAKEAGIRLACAEAERGPDQYEVSLPPSADIKRLAWDTERFRQAMCDTFAEQGIKADFSAKPMADAPGSGLHIHVHLEDGQGRNIFFREGEEFSPLLLHAIGGLLELMNPCMPIFAPRQESYARFTAGPNPYLVCPTATNVPTTVSWGTNNRTTAIRLPNKPMDNKHIEHRVAGSDADIAAVTAAVLAGVHYGLKVKCDPGAAVYGDAALPQYGLPKLAMSLAEAKRYRAECAALQGYI
jgi:glutamine synthetase